MYRRFHQHLEKYLKPGRVLVMYGPRRAGKTTLLEDFLRHSGMRYRLDSGDDIAVRAVLGSEDFRQIKEYARGVDLIAIDEAQQIPNIGMGLKIIVDQVPGIRVIATGSSSFDLAQAIGEPLTGRKRTIMLYPMAQLELDQTYSRFEVRQQLEDVLIYGAYPEIVAASSQREKRELVKEIAHSYLLRDILTLDGVKHSDTLYKLVQLLALQIGQLVSTNELATQLGLSRNTVDRYLDLLQKGFVIQKLEGYSRNRRKEINKKAKYYFLDNGVRNGVIENFNPMRARNDQGALWENFLFSERVKWASYKGWWGLRYFWRTYSGQEIDFVEEQGEELIGYEAKWSTSKRVKVPSEWQASYPNAAFKVITPDNYFDFVADEEVSA
ncbi:MAG: ATP-binding protein [Parachlamydiales bacterium]